MQRQLSLYVPFTTLRTSAQDLDDMNADRRNREDSNRSSQGDSSQNGRLSLAKLITEME